MVLRVCVFDYQKTIIPKDPAVKVVKVVNENEIKFLFIFKEGFRQILKQPVHSYRNASIGSSREAFNAGYNPEKRPTIIQVVIPTIIQLQGMRKLPPIK